MDRVHISFPQTSDFLLSGIKRHYWGPLLKKVFVPKGTKVKVPETFEDCKGFLLGIKISFIIDGDKPFWNLQISIVRNSSAFLMIGF